MLNRFAAPVFLALSFLACSDKEPVTEIDFLDYFDATIINYQSQTFTLPGDLPLNSDLPSGAVAALTAQTMPAVAHPVTSGSNQADIKSITISFKMSVEPHDFSGPATLKLYIGTQRDVYRDLTALVLTAKQVLPSTFEFTTSDSRLNLIFTREEVVCGMEFILEPSRLQKHDISISGHIDNFRAEVKGSQKFL